MKKWRFWLRGVHTMRDELIAVVDDSVLDFTPGGPNPSWGALFWDLADIEESYIQSLETLEQTFTATQVPSDLDGDILRSRFGDLDPRFDDFFDNWSDEELQTKVDRGGGFVITRDEQFEIYVQAVLIVLAKAVVYVNAMGGTLPDSAEDWIG